MKLETATRLHDAANACKEIQSLLAGFDEETFLRDRLRNLSVWKLLEIVGEALRRAEQSDSSLNQSIPNLRDIIDTRNRITHGYDSVSFTVMWRIATTAVPDLSLHLETLLLDAPDISDGSDVDR
jgi:uncharacterized protein with HEPN domain